MRSKNRLTRISSRINFFKSIFRPNINLSKIPGFKVQYKLFQNTFPSWYPIEQNDLDPNAVVEIIFMLSKRNISNFIRLSVGSIYNFHNSEDIKFMTDFRLLLSGLRERKFNIVFEVLMCQRGFYFESTSTGSLYANK